MELQGKKLSCDGANSFVFIVDGACVCSMVRRFMLDKLFTLSSVEQRM